jgi:pyridoxamine 5'-phosphate oxidase
MNKTQILEFLNANPICHLATAEGDQPRVRGMMMYQADENGIIFHTGDFKELYRQLTKNSKVEICFNAPDMSKQIRICGSAEFLDDLKLKKEIVAKRPFIEPWVKEQGYAKFMVFRVTHCKAAIWSMATNFEPTTYNEL